MTSPRPKLPIIALVSQQRSGTNVFRQMLRSSGDSHDLDDIFHGDVSGSTNFWASLARQAQQKGAHLTCPHFWYEVWETYLQECYDRLGHRIFILDLKIDYFRYLLVQNHPSAFKPEWYFFFDISNFKFIYLERTNVAAQVVSRLRAEATGDWGIPIEFEVPIRKALYIDPASLEQQMRCMELSNRFGLETIERYNPLKLTYEGLFNVDGSFSEAVLESIGRFSGLEWTKFSRAPFLHKQSGASFLDQIENKGEVVAYFRGTPYESMFVTSRPLGKTG